MTKLKYKFNLQQFNGTRVEDVIEPSVFNPYVIERTAELSVLIQSGIVVPNPELDRLASAGGRLINMPFWEDLNGDDEILDDAPGWALTPDKIESDQDVAALLMRGKAWSVSDLAKALSGDDPMRAIGDLVAAYWARQEQKVLISVLNGVFASPSMAYATHDVSIADGNAATAVNKIGAENVIDAFTILGDSADKLTAIAMHSKVYSDLQKKNLIEFVEESDSKIKIPYYLGRRVLVDDGCPRVAGTTGYQYTSYLFGQGAIGRGDGQAPYPTETDRDKLAGEDILINRRHFLLHPRGVRFTNTSVAKKSPTNAELAMPANWQRVYEEKNVRLVRLITNA